MHRGVGGPPGPRPPFDWDYLKRLKDATPMKVVLKGIVTREEAELAVQHGADGVFVSNHGGRAENSLRSTIECLPEVVAAVKGRVPVMIDSGVRRGGDIFKALALGADAVGIGRPYVWGLGAFGQPGVEKVIDIAARRVPNGHAADADDRARSDRREVRGGGQGANHDAHQQERVRALRGRQKAKGRRRRRRQQA